MVLLSYFCEFGTNSIKKCRVFLSKIPAFEALVTCLFTLKLFPVWCWLAKCWQLGQRRVSRGEYWGPAFKFVRHGCKLSLLPLLPLLQPLIPRACSQARRLFCVEPVVLNYGVPSPTKFDVYICIYANSPGLSGSLPNRGLNSRSPVQIT